jgi:hypothetical protein
LGLSILRLLLNIGLLHIRLLHIRLLHIRLLHIRLLHIGLLHMRLNLDWCSNIRAVCVFFLVFLELFLSTKIIIVRR